MPTRIVLADDHTLVREALRALIEARLENVEIVGEASTGQETLTLCQTLQPDVLVLDLSMPSLSGLDVMAELPAISPKTKVAVVSQYSERA
jgi:YesN/AraC family two-component response regulator